MKKTLHLAMLFVLSLSMLKTNAQTFVSGSITSNTTWNMAGAPYYVNGDITIDSGITLTVDSGTVVKFMGSFAINVKGTIDGKGKLGNEVHFLGDSLGPNTFAKWKGLVAKLPTTQIKLEHCSFWGAEAAVDYNQIYLPAPFSISQSDIINCTFINNDCGVRAPYYNGHLYIYNSIFRHNLIGVEGTGRWGGGSYIFPYLFDTSHNYVFIVNSLIEENQYGVVSANIQHGLLQNNSVAVVNMAPNSIDSVTFKYNGYGIAGHSVSVGGCIFSDNDSAVFITGSYPGFEKPSVISGSLFYNNFSAIHALPNSQLESVFCSWFYENDAAIEIPTYTYSQVNNKLRVFENHFINNETSLIFSQQASFDTTTGYDTSEAVVRLNIFNRGDYYVKNLSNRNLNLWFNGFIDSVKSIDDYLYDGADQGGLGYINYSVSNIYFFPTPYQSLMLSRKYAVVNHNDYDPADTLFVIHPYTMDTSGLDDTVNIGCYPLLPPVGNLAVNKPKDEKISITLYPNPAQNELNVRLPEDKEVKHVEIYSIDGRRILSIEGKELQQKELHLKLDNLPTGMYCIRVSSTEGTSSAKFVKE